VLDIKANVAVATTRSGLNPNSTVAIDAEARREHSVAKPIALCLQADNGHRCFTWQSQIHHNCGGESENDFETIVLNVLATPGSRLAHERGGLTAESGLNEKSWCDCIGVCHQFGGRGSAPAIFLNSSMTSGSRGISLITFSWSSGRSADGSLPTIFLYSFSKAGSR